MSRLSVIVAFALFFAIVFITLEFASAGGGFFRPEERDAFKELIKSHRGGEVTVLAAQRLRELDLLQKSGAMNATKRALRDDGSECKCECHTGDLNFVEPGSGYGKYCGAGYGCASGQPGCDNADACCKIHDACVNQAGYCGSCNCNIALANCVGAINDTAQGFAPCDREQKARTAILNDICTAIKYLPSACGGCSDSIQVPSACNGYPLGHQFGSSSPAPSVSEIPAISFVFLSVFALILAFVF